MLTIGRFADATGLTVKALRHYDEIGLLAPARVDPDNGYRYYDESQIEDAVTIRRLRALELPLEDIHDLVHADAGTLLERLAAHSHRVAEEVHDKYGLMVELGALVEGGGEEIDIEICDIPELRLAALIQHRLLIDPHGVTQMLYTVYRWLHDHDAEPADHPTALFRSEGYGGGTHLVEAGFPVTGRVEGDASVPVTVYLAARAATVTHHGSFDGLHETAQRFIATVLGQGLSPIQAIRIEYVEVDVQARVVWPIARRASVDS
jgi:DNA-binding transcriptional MerR regulator